MRDGSPLTILFPATGAAQATLRTTPCRAATATSANKPQPKPPFPATEQIVPLFHPRAEVWTEHLAWSSDYRLMLGLTATGRAIIARLQTNHSGVVRQREVLHQLGLHPAPER